MAPVAEALVTNTPGFGGFKYKELIQTPEGKRINWFNGQFYYDFSLSMYTKAIKNGYPPNKIVIGMIYYQFDKSNFSKALDILLDIKNKYNNFAGTFVWEYFKAPSLNGLDEYWAIDIYNKLNQSNL